jgi:AcrR family transcriptional regulator
VSEAKVPDERRALILEAGARVVSSRGVDRTRLIDVADEAGVSIGLLQHYFGTREGLLSEVFLAAIKDSVYNWRRLAAEESDPFLRLVALIRYSLSGRLPFNHVWSLYVEFWALSNRDPAMRQLSEEVYAIWAEPIREAISEGVALGRFALSSPVEDITDRLVSEIDGIGIRVLLGHPGMTRERMCRLLIDDLKIHLGVEAVEAEDVCVIAPRHGSAQR